MAWFYPDTLFDLVYPASYTMCNTMRLPIIEKLKGAKRRDLFFSTKVESKSWKGTPVTAKSFPPFWNSGPKAFTETFIGSKNARIIWETTKLCQNWVRQSWKNKLFCCRWVNIIHWIRCFLFIIVIVSVCGTLDFANRMQRGCGRKSEIHTKKYKTTHIHKNKKTQKHKYTNTQIHILQ